MWRVLPLEGLAVAIAALATMVLNHRVHASESALDVWMLRLVLAAVLVAPLLLAMTRLSAYGVLTRRVTLAIGGGLAAAIGGVLVLAVGASKDASSAPFMWCYGLSLLAAVMVPFVTTAIGAGDERLPRVTRFVRRFFEQTTTWGLLWGVGVVALVVVFVALDELFDLKVERVALDAVVVLTGLCVLVYFHRLLPAGERDRGRLPELWRRLATTVGAPFVSVMLVILVVYEISVLIQGELPRNLLSPLIIGAGFVGFLCTLLIVALLGESVGSDTLAPADPHRWGRRRSVRLARAFPLVLLALLPMAGWALSVRVEQYGFTPFRVVRMMALLCLGVMCVLGAARWLRGRMALTWEVPACVIAFALATAFGPTSAVHLSLESQVVRLEQLLTAAEVGDREVAKTPPGQRVELDYEEYQQLRDSIEVVGELGGEAALRRVLSGSVEICAERWSAYQCLEHLGVDYHGGNGSYVAAHVDSDTVFTGSAGALILFDLSVGSEVSYQARGQTLALTDDGLVVRAGGVEVARVSVDALHERWRESGDLPGEMMRLLGPDGRSWGEIAVKRMYGNVNAAGELEPSNLEGVWLPAAAAPPVDN